MHKMAPSIKKKQKVLLATLKEQQRYIVYKVLYDSVIKDFKVIHDGLLIDVVKNLGIFDSARAGVVGVKFNSQSKKGILRVNSDYVDKIKVCLGLIKELDKKIINVDTVFVSGMLNKAEFKMNT